MITRKTKHNMCLFCKKICSHSRFCNDECKEAYYKLHPLIRKGVSLVDLFTTRCIVCNAYTNDLHVCSHSCYELLKNIDNKLRVTKRKRNVKAVSNRITYPDLYEQYKETDIYHSLHDT